MPQFRDRRTGSVTDGAGFKSVDDVKRANEAAGQHWFSPESKRFFDSRVGRTLHSGPGGHYFVSSEQFHDLSGNSRPRAYTVRQAHPDGTVATVGEFQGHPTRESATRQARALAAGSHVQATDASGTTYHVRAPNDKIAGQSIARHIATGMIPEGSKVRKVRR